MVIRDADPDTKLRVLRAEFARALETLHDAMWKYGKQLPGWYDSELKGALYGSRLRMEYVATLLEASDRQLERENEEAVRNPLGVPSDTGTPSDKAYDRFEVAKRELLRAYGRE